MREERRSESERERGARRRPLLRGRRERGGRGKEVYRRRVERRRRRSGQRGRGGITNDVGDCGVLLVRRRSAAAAAGGGGGAGPPPGFGLGEGRAAAVDWRATVLLNLALQTSYALAVVACRKGALRDSSSSVPRAIAAASSSAAVAAAAAAAAAAEKEKSGVRGAAAAATSAAAAASSETSTSGPLPPLALPLGGHGVRHDVFASPMRLAFELSNMGGDAGFSNNSSGPEPSYPEICFSVDEERHSSLFLLGPLCCFFFLVVFGAGAGLSWGHLCRLPGRHGRARAGYGSEERRRRRKRKERTRGKDKEERKRRKKKALSRSFRASSPTSSSSTPSLAPRSRPPAPTGSTIAGKTAAAAPRRGGSTCGCAALEERASPTSRWASSSARTLLLLLLLLLLPLLVVLLLLLLLRSLLPLRPGTALRALSRRGTAIRLRRRRRRLLSRRRPAPCSGAAANAVAPPLAPPATGPPVFRCSLFCLSLPVETLAGRLLGLPDCSQ